MVDSPDNAKHTSAYDRIQGQRGKKIHSAAFELEPVEREAVAESLRNETTQVLKKRKAAGRSGAGKKIVRDEWLSPLPFRKSDT